MITVTRLNGPAFALNPDLIERIESTPDTVITLVDGAKYVVRESVDELVARVRESKAAIIALSHLFEHPSSGGPTPRGVPPPPTPPLQSAPVPALSPAPRRRGDEATA